MTVPAAVVRRLGDALDNPDPRLSLELATEDMTAVRRGDLRKVLRPHLPTTPATTPAPERRDVTADERKELRRLHAAVRKQPQRSPAWSRARDRLARRVAALADEGNVALGSIGDAMGVSKQRADQLAQLGRKLGVRA